MLGKIIPGNVLQDIWKYSHEELTGKNKMRFNIRQICVCVVSVVGRISDYQPEGPGFKSRPGRGLKFGRPSFTIPSVDRDVKPLV